MRLVCRISSPVLTVVQSQNLFSDTFHLLDVTQKAIAKQKAVTKDSVVFKETIKRSLNKKGGGAVETVSTKDIIKFLLLSEGQQDLRYGPILLNRAISTDLLALGYSEGTFDLIWLYMRVCYIQNLPLQATQAWEDPVIRSTNYTVDRARLARLYFDLLFTNNMFKEVLDTFNKDHDRLVTKFDCVKLTCLSCYKLGTTSSLEAGLEILAHPSCVIDTPANRSYQALALLAYNLKQFHVAYDLLVKYGSANIHAKRVPMFNKSLMLMVLADLGWLKEAVMLMDTRDNRKKVFNYYAVEKVLESAKKSSSDKLVKRIKKMNLLPYNHDILQEEGLEQMLLKEIKPSLKHSKTPETPFKFSI